MSGGKGQDMGRLQQTGPREARDTVRHGITAALKEGPASVHDISVLAGIPEKEVPGHLEHIRASLHRAPQRLQVRPAECLACGFVFEKRSRFTTPGKCPVCRSESIHPPLFSIVARKG